MSPIPAIRVAVLGVLLLLGAGSLGEAPAVEHENARIFLDAVEAYKQEDYGAAAEGFSALAESGVDSGRLYYNLGNAYFKKGDLGRAILWYERARKRIPQDPELNFNLNYARSQTRDQREEGEVTLKRVLFFWRHLLSDRAIRWIGVGLNLLFWILLAIRRLRGKRPLKGAGYLALAVAVLFALTALYGYHEDRFGRDAVILADDVPVRSGTSPGATELFVLHAGTRVTVEKETQGHYRIFFAEGKIGWIDKSRAGVI